MKHIANSRRQITASVNLRLLLLVLLMTSMAFVTNTLYGQTTVALPLATYKNDGVQVLTNVIDINLGIGVPLGTHSVSISDGGPPIVLPSTWLDYKVIDVSPANGQYQIALFVRSGACVDAPTTASDCGGACSAAIGTAYSMADVRKCYTINLEVNGAMDASNRLCIYGPGKLQATGPTATVLGRNGNTFEIDFSINRDEENFTWDLVGSMPGFFSWIEPGGDKVGKHATLIFKPTADIAEQIFQMKVVNDERACEESIVSFKVSSAGDAVFNGGPVDIVFVVDVSGSMGSTAICDCKGQPGCPDPPSKTKLRYLKEQLLQLHAQMKALARPEDRVGLVSFHSTSKIESPLVPFTDGTVTSKIDAWNDNGYDLTAIGLGLLDGVSLLTDATHQRYIILMTNGMQNVDPELTWTDGTKSTVKVGSKVFNADLKIKVIPIAIFTPSGEYRNLLNALGKGTGVSVVKDVCETNASLLDAYKESAKPMGSPKLVTFKRGTFSGGTATGTFNVNEDLDQMLVNIVNVGNQNFTGFRIEKNISGTWTDITSLGSIIPAMAQASIKRLFTMNFPAVWNGSPLNSSGEYRYTITSSISNIPYELSVIIDDRGVKHSAYTGVGYQQAGEPINLGGSLFYNGQPITNANVIVSLESPVASFSSKLSNTSIPGQYLQVTRVPLVEGRKGGFGMPYINRYAITHPSLTAMGGEGSQMVNADKKYLVLKQQGTFNGAFESRGDSVPLPYKTNGLYMAQFSNTGRVGLYTMHFLFQGNVPGVGSVTRMDVKDVYVNFGKPVLKESELHLMWEEPLVLSMKPKDASGNLLGPGHEDQISIYLSKGSASVATDYLDGRYVIRLFGISDNDDPDLIIRIRKDVLFNGKLSDIRRKRGFFSILGGYTFPLNDLDSAYDGNLMAEAKLGYRFWKKMGAQLHVGYYSFKTASENPSLNTFGGGLGLFYRLPLSSGQGWNMIAEVNGGYYKPKDIDGEFGVNGGLGLNAFVNYNLSLVLEAKYYTIFTSPSKMNFFGGSVGLKFHF